MAEYVVGKIEFNLGNNPIEYKDTTLDRGKAMNAELTEQLTTSRQTLNNALEALQLLLKAKHIKETFGKNADYEELKERGWKAAEMVVANINKEKNND